MSRGMAEPAPLGPWRKGINNVKAETRLDRDELREAVNVDLDTKGRPRLRRGCTKVYNGTDVHSLWTGSRYTLFVDGGSLKKLNSDFTATTLTALSDTTAPVSYAEVNGEVYLSNGLDTLRLVGGVPDVRPLSVPTPDAPSATTTTGTLPPGTYLLCATWMTPDGVESGASREVAVTVTSGQGVAITSVPQPPVGLPATTRIYMTTHNGGVFFLVAVLPAGTTQYNLLSAPTWGTELPTQHLTPLPAGNPLRYYAGRLYSAVGRILYFSESMRPGLTRLDHSYFLFPSAITVVEPVLDGIYVVADQTYFLAGRDPTDMKQQVVYPYGAVKGTGMRARGEWFKMQQRMPSEVAFWYSERGAVIGGPGGQVLPLMEARAEDRIYEQGASFFTEFDGIRQLGTVLTQGGPASGLRAVDSATAVIRRNGVVVG